MLPLEDHLIEFDETVTLRILATNTYVIDPASFQTTVTISDPLEKLFTTVARFQNEPLPVGMDYYAPSNWILVSLFRQSGLNFMRIDTNGFVTNWSGIANVPDEIKLTTVKTTANGFTNGTLYFGNGTNIGRLLPDGTVSNMNWVTLTNGLGTNDTLLRGSLCVDQSGSFGGNLLAVTGGDAGDEGGGVWSITATGTTTLLTTISNTHLEGLITLTNDAAKWGPWAGKIITGAESALPPLIFAISTNGNVATNLLDIQSEDFDLVPAHQNLFVAALLRQSILQSPANLLTNFVGDLLITQEGEKDMNAPRRNDHPPRLFFVRWDGTNLVKRASITLQAGDWLEHVTFAPMSLPALPPP